MAGSPLVSIVIPAYKFTYFEAALQSACAQDYDCVEIIVCDDRRDDLIKACVDNIKSNSRHPIHYHHNEKSLGEGGNTAKGLRLAQGEYIKLLHDDDVLRADCVRLMVHAMEGRDNVTLVSSRRRRIDEQGNVLPGNHAYAFPFDGDSLISGQDVINFVADYTVNFIGEPSCALVRREDILALLNEGLYVINGVRTGNYGDLVMYIKLLRQGDLIMLTEPLVDYRVSAQQYSQHVRNRLAMQDNGVFAGHQVLCQAVRDLGWYQGIDGEKNRMVRVAPLAESESLQPFDLLRGILDAFNRESVSTWLNQRHVSSVEHGMIQQYLTQHTEGRDFCVVVVDQGDGEEALAVTLASFAALAPSAVNIRRIVLTEQADIATRYPQEDVKLVSAATHIDALNQVVESYAFDWLLVLRAGERLTANGLLMCGIELAGAQGLLAVYGDEIARADDGTVSLCCRPDFNLDYFLSLPAAMAQHWLLHRDLIADLGGFSAEFKHCFEFELIVRLIEQHGIGRIGHVTEFLTVTDIDTFKTQQDEMRVLERHLQRRGYEHGRVTAPYPGHYRLHYGHQQQPLISIIIPAKDQLPRLVACVTSLMEKTRYKNYELLIVDNNSETPEARQWLNGLSQLNSSRIRVLSYPHAFNVSAMNNLAAQEARGEYLLLLSSAAAVIQDDWLDNMLNHALRPEVGIVGAKLLSPVQSIEHGGVVLGLRGPAGQPFIGAPWNAPGYMQRLLVEQNYSAVSGACLLIRTEVYHQVGGMDEQTFQIANNDTDLCLKVRDAGYLTVWTPHAQLMHEGGVEQHATENGQARLALENDAMYQKWLPIMARDPAYNVNLSLLGRGYELEADPELNWRPLSWRPLPVVMAMAADQDGCGHYRMIKPLQALKEAGIVDGKLARSYYPLPTIARCAPDSVILQRQISQPFHEWIDLVGRFTNTFKVYELDDYLPNASLKNVNRRQMPKDVLRLIRKSLGYVDRFVVSTDALKEAFSGAHRDIHVVENRLPVEWWGNLQGQRRVGKKPRVGWGGGNSHSGDLDLIVDVVKALADEVDWVFFGMCPDKLRPYVKEFHRGVEIDLYPAKLAALNLDLALAPIEENLFNRCKSNLRLLEYGACGFPVVCSDFGPYQGDLPVTRVRNRYKSWVDAIRMHLADLEATARMGDELRAAVHRDWMLSGDNLALWRKAWLPD